MFIFGHIGITLGIAFILSQLVLPRIGEGIRPKINYLFIAFGAILPDLIDKPVGRILLGESVANGRLFGHTLLFVLILVTIGLFLKDHRNEVFCLSFAAFLHLCEDWMWEMPATLLYPLYGFSFPKGIVIGESWYDYFLLIFNGSYVPALSYVFVSEIMGIVILGGLSVLTLFLFIKYFLLEKALKNIYTKNPRAKQIIVPIKIIPMPFAIFCRL